MGSSTGLIYEMKEFEELKFKVLVLEKKNLKY